jgi:Flp pilus assembly protein TadD
MTETGGAAVTGQSATCVKNAWILFAIACVLGIAMYAYTAPLGRLESSFSDPADDYYNLLVQGFRDGHLSLKKEVPIGFSHLADPYDPHANRLYQDMPYGMSDMSYYKGRLYLYFGITPVLILFWPFVALTGHYLSNRLAVAIFCVVGITASLNLLHALWRRYFAEVSVGAVALCALAVSLATGVPALLPQSDIYQVAISCGYMLTMLALGAIWCALHDAEHRCRWLMAASTAYGLAIGARPSLLLGGLILLVPVVYALRERQPIWTALMAATIPITLIGMGLLLYNALRFNNPFEFGEHFQLGGRQSTTVQYFNLRYLWFNFQVNFLEPARWNGHFPFVHKAALPPLPSGYLEGWETFGVLTNIPLVWLALAVPLAWRERSDQERSALRWFVTALCLLFGMCALTVCLYWSASFRYEVDFLPPLVFLSVIGILGLEHAMAIRDRGWRHLVRWGWMTLLGFSVVFNVLVSVKNYGSAGCSVGRMLLYGNQVPQAVRVFEKALQIDPDSADGHNDLGIALWQVGKRQEAIREYEQALELRPDRADTHLALGMVLTTLGRPEEAIRHCEEALRINPDDAETHFDLGTILAQVGRMPEAMWQWEQTLRIKPNDAEAHYNLGLALAQAGRVSEAIPHWEQTLKLKPDHINAHMNLGNALEGQGRVPDAIAHYEQVLKLRPDFGAASNALARLRAVPTDR